MNNDAIIDATNEFITKLGAEHGLTMKMGCFRYNDEGFHFKIEGRRRDIDSKEVADYKRIAPSWGLPELGSKFIVSGTTYSVVGWKRSARKNKIQIQDPYGKTFVCPVNYVLNGRPA